VSKNNPTSQIIFYSKLVCRKFRLTTQQTATVVKFTTVQPYSVVANYATTAADGKTQ